MKNNVVKIILMGLDFGSNNLGCAALGYSFVTALSEVAKHNGLFLNMISVNFASISLKGDNYEVHALPIHFKHKSFREKFKQEVKNCDLVFDFTGGDSFTDIYGVQRFSQASALKEYVICQKKPLIMGPQTIGPFTHSLTKKWAKHILKRSSEVFTRDNLSLQYAIKMFGITPKLTTDVAFMLPVDTQNTPKTLGHKNMGLNASGLLWNKGYTGKNELGVLLDYQCLMRSFIKELLLDGWTIWMIPHVVSTTDFSSESDFHAWEALKSEFPEIHCAQRFKTPMEAKGFISKMDFFVGSRMHATIAAFSQGIPTVSVAYSRKFKGLFNSLGYKYVIDANESSTDEALAELMDWVSMRDVLKKNVDQSMILARKENEAFLNEIDSIIKTII